MIITKQASAGTNTKNDALVTVFHREGEGIDVELHSIVALQFGRQIIKTAKEMAAEMGVSSAGIRIEDQGALDYVIRARVEAAIVRSMEGVK